MSALTNATPPLVAPAPHASHASANPHPDRTANDANKVAVGAAGGITTLVAAMQAHPNDPVLNGKACGALINIVGNNMDVACIFSSALLLTLFLPCLSQSSIWSQSQTLTLPIFPS